MAEFINKDEIEKKFRKLAYYYFDRYYADKTDLESRYRALGYERAADEIRMTIANVYPVKRGKWVNGKCTICGKSLEDLFTGEFYYDDNEINFCPNCGTDMRGEDND